MNTFTITEKDIYGDMPVPDGYRVIAFRPWVKGETIQIINTSNIMKPESSDYITGGAFSPRRILVKIQPVTYVFRQIAERAWAKKGEWYEETTRLGIHLAERDFTWPCPGLLRIFTREIREGIAA